MVFVKVYGKVTITLESIHVILLSLSCRRWKKNSRSRERVLRSHVDCFDFSTNSPFLVIGFFLFNSRSFVLRQKKKQVTDSDSCTIFYIWKIKPLIIVGDYHYKPVLQKVNSWHEYSVSFIRLDYNISWPFPRGTFLYPWYGRFHDVAIRAWITIFDRELIFFSNVNTV